MASTTSAYVKDPIVTKYLSSFRINDIDGIRTSLTEESIYRQLFAQQPDDIESSQLTLLRQPYLNLINVFENKDIWKIKNRYFNNEADNDEVGMYIMPLPEEKRLKHNASAICLDGNETFQKRWKLFTESSLFGLDWSNVFAAGGAVLSCLLPIPKKYDISPRKIREWYHDIAYQNSDIDLFIYGLDEEAAKQKMLEIYEIVCNTVPCNVACFRSKHCVTILSQYPYRHIQIVLRLYNSPSEILTGFDVDCCSVGFDGENVWALPRAHQAIIKQRNIIDLTRRSPSYEMRLAKYAERGFEIKVPLLERSRIDPTIYERNFEELSGLARLLVLERLNTPNNRFNYVKKKHERNFRLNHSKSGLYGSRRWRRVNNYGENKFENSNYETVILPYGPKYDAKRIMKCIYTRDMILNSSWYEENKKRVLHRHVCFFGTNMKHIFNDCCGNCPVPSSPEEIATQIEEDKIYIRGKMEFIKDDPGRQTVGSFHPLTDDDWTTQAYITNVREDLCSACARGVTDIVKRILNQSSLSTHVEGKDHLGRTPLQLAVLGGHTEIVKILLEYNARIIAKMSDGKTVVHLASQYGFLDILELLLQKSDENKKKAQKQKEYTKSFLEATSQMQTLTTTDEQYKTNNDDMEVDDSFEIVDKVKNYQELSITSEEQDDIIDLNTESWDHSLAPLDYAILFGQVEIVKRLVKAGANVRRLIKLQNTSSYHHEYKAYFPLGLCLLTQNQKSGLEIATILLENGATASQLNYNFDSILHLAVRTGKMQFIKLLFDMDPKSLQIINSVNSSLESPLCIALSYNHLEIADLLMKHGARAYITLEDVQEYKKRQKDNRCTPEDLLQRAVQPLSQALHNNMYRVLIEAGAQVNYINNNNYTNIRDHVENLIRNNKIGIEKYERELASLNGKKSQNEEKTIIILQYLDELIEKEKKISEGTYRTYLLNCYTAADFYDFYCLKNPGLCPHRNNITLRKPYEDKEVNEKEKYTELLELEIKRLNYNTECLEYLISHGVKSHQEISLEYSLDMPKKLIKGYQEQLNAVKKLLEEQTGILTTEAKERYLKEESFLQQAINNQQEQIDGMYKNYLQPIQPVMNNNYQDSQLELSLKLLSENTLSSFSESLIKMIFDEFIMNFKYIDYKSPIYNHRIVVPAELVPEYEKLFQAVYINDINLVEKMSQVLVFAVQDKCDMTPFTLACLRGHNELAVRILDIVDSQYKIDNDGDTDSLDYEYQEPSQSTSTDVLKDEDNKSKYLTDKPRSNCSAYEFLKLRKSFINIDVIPKEFLNKKNLNNQKYSINGFEIAVLKNDLETVKKILDWAEKHKCVGTILDNNFPNEKTGGLVASLIRGDVSYSTSNLRNPMIDSIHFGYVDMMDVLIEYAAGGNRFSVFNIKDPEEVILKKQNYYQGLDVDGHKKQSWMDHYIPRPWKEPVEPSYLFYAAYYGNIKSLQYFYSERPIKALNKFVQNSTKNNSKDLRLTILNTIEDVQKVGRKLFSYELHGNETPFHWAVQENKHDFIKELARLYKEKEQAGDDEEQPLTLEEILDMRAGHRRVTALHFASQCGYNESIRTLLEVGADPGITDHNGWSPTHYAVDNDKVETIKLLHELLQPETYQRMLEQRSKSFNHTPISISILNSNIKMTEYLLQQVTTANLFTYDFENNRNLHLSLREGLWYISKKLIELESKATIGDDKRFGSLYHENAFGQTPTDIAIQMFLNRLASDSTFEPPPNQLPPELYFNEHVIRYNYYYNYEVKKTKEEEEEKCAVKAFNLMVPFYLPKYQGNPTSKRVLVEFDKVNNMVHKLSEKVSRNSARHQVESTEKETKISNFAKLHNI